MVDISVQAQLETKTTVVEDEPVAVDLAALDATLSVSLPDDVDVKAEVTGVRIFETASETGADPTVNAEIELDIDGDGRGDIVQSLSDIKQHLSDAPGGYHLDTGIDCDNDGHVDTRYALHLTPDDLDPDAEVLREQADYKREDLSDYVWKPGDFEVNLDLTDLPRKEHVDLFAHDSSGENGTDETTSTSELYIAEVDLAPGEHDFLNAVDSDKNGESELYIAELDLALGKRDYSVEVDSDNNGEVDYVLDIDMSRKYQRTVTTKTELELNIAM